jgi:AraC family transcriptional regulator, regulatory protein of adaptative response / methylated-DNA-[protein]-cysteine methyltransferase
MLLDEDRLYAALLERDAALAGVALVCVTSTGIFCRLTCPARKPKRENCRFEPSVEACVAAGFRACKRCHPGGWQAEAQIFSPLAGSGSAIASNP